MAQDPLWSLIDLATSSLCICNSTLGSPVCSCNVNDLLRTAIRLQSRDWRPFLHEKFGCWLSCSAPPKVYRLLLALSQCHLRSGSFQGGAAVCILGGSLLHDVIVSGIGLLAKIILTHHAQLFLHLAVQIFLLAYLATCRFSCCDHSFWRNWTKLSQHLTRSKQVIIGCLSLEKLKTVSFLCQFVPLSGWELRSENSLTSNAHVGSDLHHFELSWAHDFRYVLICLSLVKMSTLKRMFVRDSLESVIGYRFVVFSWYA